MLTSFPMSAFASVFGKTRLLAILVGLTLSANAFAAAQNVEVYARAGVQGTPLTGYVASFTTSESSPSLASLSSTINWGDGTLTAGTIETSVIAGLFTVSNSHTYLSAGTYTISVTVTDSSDGGNGSGGNVATIQNAPLIVTGMYFQTKPNVPFNGLIATFLDQNPYASIADFTATVNWGDGTALGIAAISQIGLSDTYDVTANHTYALSGLKVVTITVHDGNNLNMATGTSYTGDRIFANGFDG